MSPWKCTYPYLCPHSCSGTEIGGECFASPEILKACTFKKKITKKELEEMYRTDG